MKDRSAAWLLIMGALTACLAGSDMAPALAQIPSAGVDDSPGFRAPAEARWKRIAVEDVNAAYRLLHDNHPGAASEMHDTLFVRRLEEAHAQALQRAGTVESYQGYLAVLAGFANAMGDKHIWSRPTFVVNLPRWPGMVVSKRGSVWIVTDTEPLQSALLGASLISCDGDGVEDLARKNLGGFRAIWSIGAQQVQAAPWLLVDEGNPFITRPKECVFEQGGKRQTVRLQWDRIKRENLLPRLKKAVGVGAAGFDLRKVGAGYWIALQDLDSDRALAVVKSVEARQSALRTAAFVVLDLRGNGGGSSVLGDQIAASLLGRKAVDARTGPSAGGCDDTEVFRATRGNLAQLEFLRSTPFVMHAPPAQKKLMDDAISRIRAALAQGRALSGPVNCQAARRPVMRPQPPSLLKGKLVLLTDNACFSSCLAVADEFRTLGALHVGQTTDAATWYVDVREQYLPSGYSMFSTLQAVSGDSREVGPFAPTVTYNGDIADTAALEQWVGGLVKRVRSVQPPGRH